MFSEEETVLTRESIYRLTVITLIALQRNWAIQIEYVLRIAVSTVN